VCASCVCAWLMRARNTQARWWTPHRATTRP
jgi:hypothetical protein